MKAKIISIETWLPVFPGFYGTIFEADNEMSNELDDQNQERDSSLPKIEWDDINFDSRAYEKEVVEQCTQFIEDQLKSLGMVTAIRLQSVTYPREYNFANNSGNIEIDLTNANFKAIKAYIYAHRDEYDGYLERYKSYSGFISYYDHDFDGWKEYTNNFTNYSGKTHYLGSILDFVCLNEEITTEDMYYSLEVYVSEYSQNRTNQVKCEECGKWYEVVDSPEHKEYDRTLELQAKLWNETQGKSPLIIKSFKECYPEFALKCEGCR